MGQFLTTQMDLLIIGPNRVKSIFRVFPVSQLILPGAIKSTCAQIVFVRRTPYV